MEKPPENKEAAPAKVRLSATDFLPRWEQYPIGHADKHGKAICYGHTVRYQGEELLVCYRYGQTVLKRPFMIAGISLTAYAGVEVLAQMTACEDWLVIGYDNDPFIQQFH